MKTKRILGFGDFYRYYLNQHAQKGTRITHFVGTSFFLLFLVFGSIYMQWWLILSGIVVAYCLAWVGHFFIERNKPATFKYPLWSLISDFKLYFQILSGKERFDPKNNK